MASDQQITVQGLSHEAQTLSRQLPFDPPYVDIAPNPEGFHYWWRLMDFVFELPSPREFPKLPELPSPEDLEKLHRYIDIAPEIATSTLMNHSSEVRISVTNNGGQQVETVKKEFASSEVTRGFAVLFRQYYSNDESASFKKVHNILCKLSVKASDGKSDHRIAVLNQWKKAHSRLRGVPLKTLVGMRMRDQGLLGGPVPGESDKSAEYFISVYNYGEYIHWGDRRKELAAFGGDPAIEALNKMKFLEAVGGLSHLYLGFSMLARSALGE